MMATMGLAEIVILLMMGGSFFSADDFMGMPPKQRHAALVQAAPAGSLIFGEWAERSTGEAGAAGVDGLIADMEVRMFLQKLEGATRQMLQQELENASPETQVLGRAVPEILLLLMNRPGCVFVDFDPEKVKVDPSFGPPTPAMLAPGFSAAVVIHAGPEADQVAKNLELILGLLPGEIRTTGIDRQLLPVPIPGIQVVVHREGEYFILAAGESTLDDVLQGLNGKRPGMESNPRFQRAIQDISFPRTSSVAWIDIKNVVERAATVMGPMGAMVKGMADQVGFSSIDAYASAAGVVDGQIRSHSFLMTDGSVDGILALAAGRAIQKEDFALIPADADMLIAFSVSFPKILAAVREVVGKTDPGMQQQLDAVIGQLESEIGLSLQDDIFASMDDVWTVYDSPSAGGVLITSAVMSIHVRDAEAAYRTMSQLMKLFKAALPEPSARRGNRGVFLAESQFLDRTIYFVNTVGDDVPVAPAFCVTDKEFLFSIHPQALKAHLRMLSEDVPMHAGIDTKEGELLSYAVFDAESAIRYMYTFTPYFAQIIFSEAQREGFQMDVFSFPSARALLPYLSKGDTRVIRKADGIHSLNARSLPIPGAASVLSRLPIVVGFGAPFMFLAAPVRAIGQEAIEAPAVAVPKKAAAVPARRLKPPEVKRLTNRKQAP